MIYENNLKLIQYSFRQVENIIIENIEILFIEFPD